MGAFRILLVAIFAGILGYTAIVAGNHGLGLLEVFFSDIAKMGWPGQFNVDFMSLLTLSGLWLAWRHHFSPVGIVLGLLGFFGGGLFLSAYLFLASVSAKGDMKALLLGKVRAAA
jgi:hypothetical protein